MLVLGFWGLYLGATSLWRESGIDKVPHQLSLTELRDGTVPNNRLLKVSDAECDLGHGVAYLEHYTPQAYYIPLVTPLGKPESETPPAGRRIILRLTKKLYDAHSGALQNAGAPLTVEGIRLLNSDIESRIEEFLKKELGIANLDNAVVIDGGRKPIGSLLPIKVLIISSAWLLILFFNFAKKPKLAWSAIAVLCGAFAIVPDRLSLEPDYESPLVSRIVKGAKHASRLNLARESTSSGSSSTIPATPSAKARTEKEPITSPREKLRKAAEQGEIFSQFALGLLYANGEGQPKNAVEAVKWYRAAAEQGFAPAQYQLGDMYRNGNGVGVPQRLLYAIDEGIPKDAVEAVKWYKAAADQGFVRAQYQLGDMYRNGNGVGVAQNIAEAAKWYRKAAEQGDAEAKNALGRMFARVEAVPKDPAEAVTCYRAAAETGHAAAQFKLGLLYAKGEGVTKDAAEAVRWYRLSANQGYPSAETYLGCVYSVGLGVSKDAVQSAAWYRKAAEHGQIFAQFRMGAMYAKGEGVAKDAIEAAKWCRKAAEQGDASAQNKLGDLYSIGEGVAKDAVEAVKWYRKAAEQGDANAQNHLGFIYDMGHGVSKNSVESVKWYRKAAEQGYAKAQRNLGCMYNEGKGVTKDPVESVKWYRKAAEQGDANAQNNLGFMYEMGHGVSKSPVESVKWYRKAAEQGYDYAQYRLGLAYAVGKGVPKDEIEALSWITLGAASGDNEMAKTRTLLEQRLGQQVSLLAQQRSKAILREIQARKANSVGSQEFSQPGNTNNDTAPRTGQSGTGVFVTTDGLILTAAHVVKSVSSIEIQTSHGLKPGRLVKVDTKNDLALIRCEGNFQPAPVKAPRDVKLGQAVFTIGFPNVELQGVSPKMTRGEISSLAGLQDDPRQWQISVPVQPGNSGGPLFDEAGNVIGVIVAKLNAIKAAKFTGDLSQNVNYAVKSAPALQLLAPYSEKLARERQVNPSDKVENVVEQCRESVVLIFGYGP
jgi:TPR repeat protein